MVHCLYQLAPAFQAHLSLAVRRHRDHSSLQQPLVGSCQEEQPQGCPEAGVRSGKGCSSCSQSLCGNQWFTVCRGCSWSCSSLNTLRDSFGKEVAGLAEDLPTQGEKQKKQEYVRAAV